jgi:hypothetical protein
MTAYLADPGGTVRVRFNGRASTSPPTGLLIRRTRVDRRRLKPTASLYRTLVLCNGNVHARPASLQRPSRHRDALRSRPPQPLTNRSKSCARTAGCVTILAAGPRGEGAQIKAGDLECHASSLSRRPKRASAQGGILNECCSAKFSGARSGPGETS